METKANGMDKLSKGDALMSDANIAQNLIHEAFPTDKHGNAKASMWAAYRKLKLSTERRARSIWNGEAKRIDAHEMAALKQAALKEARREFQETANRIVRLETALATTDADFYSEEISALKQQAIVFGRENSTGTDNE